MNTNQFLVALLAFFALAAIPANAGKPPEPTPLGPGGRLPLLETTDGNSWRDVVVKEINATHVVFFTWCDAEIPVTEIVSPRLDEHSVGRKFAEIRLRSGRVFRDASLAGFLQVEGKKIAVLLFRCEQRVELARLEHRLWWQICREIPIAELLTRSGLRYRQVCIRDIKVERLLIFHEKGVSWVPLRELPGSLRERVESRQTAVRPAADTAPVGELKGSDQIITTVDGTIYRKVVITGHSAHALAFLHENGAAVVPFKELSQEIQRRYGFTPAAVRIDQAIAKDPAAAVPSVTHISSLSRAERHRVLVDAARLRRIEQQKQALNVRHAAAMDPQTEISVQVSQSGDRWAVIYDAPGRRGRRTFASKTEADTWAAHKRQQVNQLATTGTSVKYETSGATKVPVPTEYTVQQRTLRNSTGGGGGGGSYGYTTYRYYTVTY